MAHRDPNSIASQAARANLAGLVRFNTGQPCQHGHTGDRYTATGQCIACHNIDVSRRSMTGAKRLAQELEDERRRLWEEG